MNFRIIFTQCAGSFRLLVEFFDGHCILRVQGKILTKTVLFQSSFSFGHWAIFLTNSRKSSGVVKTRFSVSMETFRWKSFGKPENCSFFENPVENFRLAVQKKSAGFPSGFLPLHGNFPKKKFLKSFWIFCGLFRIISGNWAGKVWSACQNCILRINGKVFWTKNCSRKQLKFFVLFDTEQTFSASFLAGFLQLHSTCP